MSIGGERAPHDSPEHANVKELPAKVASGVLPVHPTPPRPRPMSSAPPAQADSASSPPVEEAVVLPRELPVGYLADKLDDAELLLRYAAEAGIEIEPSVRSAILNARLESATGLRESTATKLLSGLTVLSARVRPVTAENLRAGADPEQSKKVIREYTQVALVLSAFIVPFSLLTFASSAISDSIRKDTDTANTLAVKLSDELGPPRGNQESGDRRYGGRYAALPVASAPIGPPAPVASASSDVTAPDTKASDDAQSAAPGSGRSGVSRLPRGVSEKDVIRDLQQFAATIRAIDARARQLNAFTLNTVKDPFDKSRGNRDTMRQLLELPADLPDLARAATDKIGVYQDVRYFAQTIQEMVSMSYGAVGTNVLPVLYALLGACAYLLRLFQEQIKNRTFTPADGHSARFLIAAIGGFVVGLFNNFNITQGVALSPLAIAFLVGYAVDVFFSFLEGILQAFDRSRAGSKPTGSHSKG